MKIKADGRGRISLAQLGLTRMEDAKGFEPHAEFNTKYVDGQLVIVPVGQEKPKEEWVKVGHLTPDHIGQVIGIDWDYLGLGLAPSIRYGSEKNGLYGVLKWYLTGQMGADVVKVKIAGYPVIDFKNYGLFWVRSA